MKCGLFNLPPALFGTGPGGAGLPIWTATVYIPQASSVVSDIAAARANGITLFANLATSRGNWVDVDPVSGCQNFNLTKYTAKVNSWTVAGGATTAVANAITSALADRTMIAYVIDEPFLSVFCGTIPNQTVNNLGLLHKTNWPGCITCIRASAQFMETPLPSGGWTGIDYGWAQFVGQHVPSAGESPLAFFNDEKARLAALNCGVIAGLNIWDGGIYNDLDGITACWDYANNNVSSGYVKGTLVGGLAPTGTVWGCGTRPAAETRMIANPELIQRCADVIYNDPDIPAWMGWTHSSSSALGSAAFTALNPYYIRNDFEAAFNHVINVCNSRTAWNGSLWRTAK